MKKLCHSPTPFVLIGLLWNSSGEAAKINYNLRSGLTTRATFTEERRAGFSCFRVVSNSNTYKYGPFDVHQDSVGEIKDNGIIYNKIVTNFKTAKQNGRNMREWRAIEIRSGYTKVDDYSGTWVMGFREDTFVETESYKKSPHCRKNKYRMSASKEFLDGSVDLTLDVPPDSYAAVVKLRADSTPSMANHWLMAKRAVSEHVPFTKPLNLAESQPEIIWVKPGGKFKYHVQLSKISVGDRLRGWMDVEIQFLRGSSAPTQLSKLQENLVGLLQKSETNRTLSFEETRDSLIPLLDLLAQPQKFRSLLAQASRQELNEFSTVLNAFAWKAGDARFFDHKIVASLLGFKLADHVMQTYLRLCDQKDKDEKGRETKIYFVLKALASSALRKLETNEMASLMRTLNEVQRLNEMDVATEEKLNSLGVALEAAVAQSQNLGQSATRDITQLSQRLKTFEGPGLPEQKLLKLMDKFHAQEKTFLSEMRQSLADLRASPELRHDLSHLKKLYSDMMLQKLEIAEVLESSLKLFSDSDPDSFLQTLLQLVSDKVVPLRSASTESNNEKLIREFYVSQDQIENLIKRNTECLFN